MSKLDRSLMSADVLYKVSVWRSPIFMVDRITDFIPEGFSGKNKITVVKHITFNEPFIVGHFVDHPVMPGVLISEACCQACEYLSLMNDFIQAYTKEMNTELKKFDDVSQALSTQQGIDILVSERCRMIGFLAAQDVKYKNVVYPGDTLYIDSEIAFIDSNGFYHYNIEARVGRNIACSGRIINFRAPRETNSNRLSL